MGATFPLPEFPVALIPEASSYSVEELRVLLPGARRIVVADFYVRDAENGIEIPGGYRLPGGIDNVDHHTPTARMARPISSTPLALEYIRAFGSVQAPDVVVIHHTDADASLSALTLVGAIPADERFAASAIAADHTGASNLLGDTLQALQERRDLSLALRIIRQWQRCDTLEPVAQEALARRVADRERARTTVNEGVFKQIGLVTYAVVQCKIDSGLLPALLPDAAIIMLASPLAEEYWEVKLRLGAKAPDGFSLNELGLAELDPAFGGRWNAGSNKRGGGTPLDPQTYAKWLSQLLTAKICHGL